MALLPSSPRKRRRLVRLTLGAGVALAIGGAVLLSPTHSHPRSVANPGGSARKAAVGYLNPASVHPSPAVRAAARKAVSGFVLTAVLRRHVERSWALVAPSLRRGFTQGEWDSGSIPIVPYPAAQLGVVRWKATYAYRDRLGYELLFMPKPAAALKPVAFDVEVHRSGPRWLVSEWVPANPGTPVRTATADTYVPPRHMGTLWLIAPGIVFALILLCPAFVLTREWFLNARAEKNRLRRADSDMTILR